MQRISWMFIVIMSALILFVSFAPVDCIAQEEEEEEIQPKGPDDRPNPMDRTMRNQSRMGRTMMLNDGRRLQQGMQGGKPVWFVVGKNGQKTIANGSYALQNGSTISMQRGSMKQMQMKKGLQMR